MHPPGPVTQPGRARSPGTYDAAMAVIGFDIARREPYEGGERFGEVGAYERIEGVAHYAVDPNSPRNAAVVDLEHAQRGSDGLVHFEGDVSILAPADAARASGTVLVEVPNRGNRTMVRLCNRAPVELEPTERIQPGDGFLFRHGWTIAFCGWQWDVPRSPARLGLAAPVAVEAGGRPLRGPVQLRLQLHADTERVALTDQHVGRVGEHTPLPVADVDDPDAVLWVRDGLHDPPVALDRSSWRFAGDSHVELDGGFRAGRIYDLVYTAGACPVVGAGLLAVRDLAAFVRDGDQAINPLAGRTRHVITAGQSQCGRFLRTLLHAGLDRDEVTGRPVFDGVLAHIAGGRRGEFNFRFAQPSVQPTPGFGHQFPFADAPQTDPRTGQTDGVLARTDPAVKVMYTNTASEYWRGDASLAHSSVVDGSDVEPPANTRHYLFADAQHGPGMLPLMDRSIFGSRGGNAFDIVDYTPLFRAALTNLAAWVADGVEPPASAVPRWADGTATSREDALDRLAAIGGFARPDPSQLARLAPLDLGPQAGKGVGRYPPVEVGEPYPCFVSALDDDGNEVAGVRMPDVSVPVATHAGFNPRHPETGGTGQLLEYLGSTVPFPATGVVPGDPRPPIAARYADWADYEARVRAAAERLVAERHLLADDVEVCIRIARKRFDALAAPAASA